MAKKYNCTKNGEQYYRIKRTINGKEKEFYGDGERDAARKYEAYMAKVNQGINPTDANVKFRDGIRHWIYNVKRHQEIKGK